METSILISTTSFYLISKIFGQTMFIQSISDTSRKILNKIESGIFYNNDIENMYIDIDIVVTINTLQLLINEIILNNSSTLNIALNNLNTIIIEIHDILKSIEEKNNNHKEKYFSWFRSLNFYKEIQLINKKNNILEKRLNLLIKILQINSLNQNKLSSERRITL
jgi:hypothetical protein